MWTDPLAVTIQPVSPTRYRVIARDALRTVVGVATVHVGPTARTGYFGEMRVDADGAPRQRVRCMVLLIREAIRHAQDIGLTYGDSHPTPALRAFVARITGHDPFPVGDTATVGGQIAELRSQIFERTTADGDER